MRYWNIALVAALLVSLLSVASEARPKVKVASDGFPTGQATPEGAAADLARAYIQKDPALFRRVCIRPYGRGSGRNEYVRYLDGVSRSLKEELEKGTPPSDNPKKIGRVFAVRPMSRNGPASYGYAGFDFQEVMFVDVEVELNDGARFLRRTLVIKDHDGKWYVHPVPKVDPLLCYGLEQESASVKTFAQVYEIEK
jgi:hypothetical protein